ncbi:MAG: hypothetical protein ACOCYU_06855 [Brevefilum sp.]
MPIALLQNYDLSLLWHEGQVMNDCAECHNGTDFHRCETRHDDHGAVELAGVQVFEGVDLTGDVPDPTFFRVNEAMPNQQNMGTHITLFEFLSQNGVENFESVTFITNDGGLATIEYEHLDETAMLVPYIDGVRFVTESVHSSTWLKAISRIIVVGIEKPLTIDGMSTSIGRLLIGETTRITVEGSNVMLTDEAGETSHALVANWAEGARLLPLLETSEPNSILVTNASGEKTELFFDEIQDAIIAIVRDSVTLVLPDRGRSVWPTDIVKIESSHQ